MKTSSNNILAAASLLLVFAASSQAETTDTITTVALGEVSVIASPKENSPLREQPMSSTVLGAAELKEKGITSLKGVSQIVPNFFMPDYGSRLTSAVYIRGIGSRINNPAVGLYVDNVPFHDKSAFDFNLTDIERVEVLRGPQGTLYGRNTMGGLIKAYTRSPLTYSGTDVHLGYATGDNHRTASFTHYHHPADRFAWYIGGYYEGSDGFFTHDTSGEKVDDLQAAGGRLRALWLPGDRLKFDLNVNFDHNIEGAYPYYYTGAVNAGRSENSEFSENSEISESSENSKYSAAIGKITNNRSSNYRRNVLNVGLNTQWEADRFTLSNVTGFQGLRDRMFMDQDFLADDIYTIEQRQRISNISNELTLKSKGENRWQWVTGASVMHQALRTTGPVTFMADGVAFLEQTINRTMPTPVMMGQAMPMSVKLNDENIMMGGTFDTPVLNAAMFHQSAFDITNALKLTLGLRLDYEHNSLRYNAPGAVNYDFTMTSPMMPVMLKGLTAAPLFDGTMKNDYWQLMPKAALQYSFGKHGSVYATISRGTRSGGYNVQMFSDLLQGELQNIMMAQVKEGTIGYLNKLAEANPKMPVGMIVGAITENMPEPTVFDVENTVTYRPEYSWNYEVGTHLSTADNRWQADAAVFFLDTRDQQIARFANSGLGRMMVNAGHSQSRGAEVSLRGEPVSNLAIALNYGYTYATFTDYDSGNGLDYTGNYVPFVPKHTVSADADYTLHFQNSWAQRLTLGATYTGAGRIYWTEANNASQQYYSTLALRAVLQTKLVQIELWGRNITDADYDTFYFETMSRGFAQRSKPAQAGIDLRWHF